MRLTMADAKYFNKLIHHPSIFSYITDDYAVFCEPNKGRLGEHFLKNDGYVVLGPEPGAAFILTPINLTTWQVHTLILPKLRGQKAIDLGKLSTLWMFENTTCEKIISFIPTENRRAKLFALRVGFKVDCLLTKSIRLNRQLADQWLVSVEKEKFLCQQQSLQ